MPDTIILALDPVCSHPECQTTAGCAYRGPNGEYCYFYNAHVGYPSGKYPSMEALERARADSPDDITNRLRDTSNRAAELIGHLRKVRLAQDDDIQRLRTKVNELQLEINRGKCASCIEAENEKLRAALLEAGEAMLDWHCLTDDERDEITNKTRALSGAEKA